MGSTSASSLLSAKQNAKESVDIEPCNPTSIAIWFHCSVRAERGGLVDIDEVIRELDQILVAAMNTDQGQGISDDNLFRGECASERIQIQVHIHIHIHIHH